MKKRFKALALVLAMLFVFGMVSCDAGKDEQTTTDAMQTENTEEATTAAVDETTEVTEKASESKKNRYVIKCRKMSK